MTTAAFSAFALEPFPEIKLGDDLAAVIIDTLSRTGTELLDGDIVVVASKVVSIAEKHRTLHERLEGARSNLRFAEKRIADLEVQLLEQMPS